MFVKALLDHAAVSQIRPFTFLVKGQTIRNKLDEKIGVVLKSNSKKKLQLNKLQTKNVSYIMDSLIFLEILSD